MERDEETGLSYHTARYYAPWIGRWCSTDPDNTGATLNLFAYTAGNPVLLVDANGREARLPTASIIRERAAAASAHFPMRVERGSEEIRRLREMVSAPLDQWGWGYNNRGSSIRVDFTYRDRGENRSFLGTIYERLTNQRVAESIRDQLETVRTGGTAGGKRLRHFYNSRNNTWVNI